MAFEPATALSVFGAAAVVVFVVGTTVQLECVVVVAAVVGGGCFCRLGVDVGGAAEFDAEEANALFFDGGCGANEGELRERFNVHQVMGFSLFVHDNKEGREV